MISLCRFHKKYTYSEDHSCRIFKSVVNSDGSLGPSDAKCKFVSKLNSKQATILDPKQRDFAQQSDQSRLSSLKVETNHAIIFLTKVINYE